MLFFYDCFDKKFFYRSNFFILLLYFYNAINKNIIYVYSLYFTFLKKVHISFFLLTNYNLF